MTSMFIAPARGGPAGGCGASCGQAAHDAALGAAEQQTWALLGELHPASQTVRALVASRSPRLAAPEPLSEVERATVADQRQHLSALRAVGALPDSALLDQPWWLLQTVGLLEKLALGWKALSDPVTLVPPWTASPPPFKSACDRVLTTYPLPPPEKEVGLYTSEKRTVNNGLAQAVIEDGTGAAYLHAVYLDALDHIVYALLSPTGDVMLDSRWIDFPSAPPGPPGYPVFYRWLSPSITDLGNGRALISWLQAYFDDVDTLATSAVWQVCAMEVEVPADLLSAPAVVVAESAPFGVALGAPDGGFKYLASSGGGGRAGLVWTEYGVGGARVDGAARFVIVQSGGYGPTVQVTDDPASVGPLRFFDAQYPALTPTERASDPSVAMAPDGSYALFGWEEEISRYLTDVDWAFDPSGTYLMFAVLELAREGFEYFIRIEPVMDDNSVVQGGDLCVALTSEGAYLAHQATLGANVYLRSVRTVDLLDTNVTPNWGLIGASPGHSILGRGWLAGVTAVFDPDLGTHRVFVAWEETKADLLENDMKSVGAAFVDWEPGAPPTATVETLSYGPVCSCVLFHLNPTGVIGPIYIGDLPTASLFWFDVDLVGAEVRLLMRTYIWGGSCLPLV